MQQRENGCFWSAGRILHKAMKGGVGEQAPGSLTIYALIAMLESGIDRQASALVFIVCWRFYILTPSEAMSGVIPTCVTKRDGRISCACISCFGRLKNSNPLVRVKAMT